MKEGRQKFRSCQNVDGTGSTDVDEVEQADGTKREKRKPETKNRGIPHLVLSKEGDYKTVRSST